MDFSTITNLNAYVKDLKLKTNWDLKQQKGLVTAKGLTLDEWLDSSQTKTSAKDTAGGQRDEKLVAIHAKIDAGGKLTQKERDYLQEKDPQAYQELLQEERAQRAYEQKLRRCRTQEEVKRLQMNHINGSMMTVRSIEHNPHITQQKKLEIAMREKRMTDQVAKITREFIRKGEYAQLPTEAEEAAARQEEAELLHPAEKVEQMPEEGAKDVLQESQTPSIAGEEVGEAKIAAPKEEVHATDEPEVVTESPTLRKVRRARAKSAYSTSVSELLPFQDASQPALDRKA